MTNLSGANLNNGAAVGPQGEGRESPSRFPKYPAYKDSGVEWLGEVPDHWESRRLKFLFSLQKRPVVDGDGIVTCFRDGAVTLRSNRRTDGFTNAEKEIGYQGIRKGDLVIHAMDAFAGAIGVSDSDGKSSPVYSACTPNEGVSAYYFARLLRHMALAGFVSSLAKGIRERSTDFRWSDASEICLPLPSISEQTQIARFLDHETARIDALIEEQQRLIELLKEKRQAVISHAVTKGLDPTVPMKDSGVEWLGEVPAHWEVTPLKHVVATPITDGPHETPDFIDEGVLFVSAEAVSSGRINFSKARYISRDDHLRYSRKYRPQKFDIYMVKSGATTGVTAIVETDDEFNIWSPLAVVRCKPQYSPYFVLFSMRSRNFQESVVVNWSFGTQQNIGMNVIENLPIACPPADEQKKIAAFITQESEKWDSLISEGVRAVHLLQERRSALISAAVTGKIDVRGWQPPASTQAPELDVAEAV